MDSKSSDKPVIAGPPVGQKEVMPNNKSVYMHLLDGQPAYFDVRVSDICFASDGTPLSALLVESLKVIRQQQMRAECARHAEGLGPRLRSQSYLRFKK